MSEPRRKNASDLTWFEELYRDGWRRMSFAECEQRCNALAEDVANTVRGRKAVWGWSGGKDSVVLAHILKLAGVEFPGVCVLTQLEYPAVDWFCTRRKPSGVEVMRTGHDIRWLIENKHMLFPQDAATKSRWYSMVQQAGLDRFAKRHQADMIIMGRRRADGNVVPHKVYGVTNGPDRYNPLLDTSHEFIWACIRHFGLPEYPQYSRIKWALVDGTGPWPQERSWVQVAETDPGVYHRYRGLLV